MVGIYQVCHLVHDQIIQYPFGHICQLVGDADGAICRSTASTSGILVRYVPDGIYTKLATEILVIEIIESLLEILVIIEFFS